MLPVAIRPMSAAPRPTRRRLEPIERASSTGWARRHGEPEIVAGKTPVSCVNATVPSAATSRMPWCNSTAGSSMRTAAVAARPTVWRPGGSVIQRSQAGPIATATSTPFPDLAGGSQGGATEILEPTRNPAATSRSVGAATRSSIASGMVAGRSRARARSATESVAACGWMTTRAPSGPIASHAGSCSIRAQWAPTPTFRNLRDRQPPHQPPAMSQPPQYRHFAHRNRPEPPAMSQPPEYRHFAHHNRPEPPRDEPTAPIPTLRSSQRAEPGEKWGLSWGCESVRALAVEAL